MKKIRQFEMMCTTHPKTRNEPQQAAILIPGALGGPNELDRKDRWDWECRHQQNAKKSALELDDSVPTLRFSTRECPIFEEHSEFSGLGA